MLRFRFPLGLARCVWDVLRDMRLLLEVLANVRLFSWMRNKSDGVVRTPNELAMIVKAEGIAKGIVGVAANMNRSTDVPRYITSVDCRARYQQDSTMMRMPACEQIRAGSPRRTISYLADHIGPHNLWRPFHVRHLCWIVLCGLQLLSWCCGRVCCLMIGGQRCATIAALHKSRNYKSRDMNSSGLKRSCILKVNGKQLPH